jgi:hypothetical protein
MFHIPAASALTALVFAPGLSPWRGSFCNHKFSLDTGRAAAHCCEGLPPIANALISSVTHIKLRFTPQYAIFPLIMDFSIHFAGSDIDVYPLFS